MPGFRPSACCFELHPHHDVCSLPLNGRVLFPRSRGPRFVFDACTGGHLGGSAFWLAGRGAAVNVGARGSVSGSLRCVSQLRVHGGTACGLGRFPCSLPPSRFPHLKDGAWRCHPAQGWEDGDCMKSTAPGLARAGGGSVTAGPAPHPVTEQTGLCFACGPGAGWSSGRGAAVLSLLLTHPQGGGSGEKQHFL